MSKSSLDAFNAIADIAATHWFRTKSWFMKPCAWAESEAHRKADGKAFSFRRPSFSHPSGYYAALKFIASSENGLTRRELCEKLNVKNINLTATTLTCAGMAKLDAKCTHKFTITPFGRAYIALAELAKPSIEKHA